MYKKINQSGGWQVNIIESNTTVEVNLLLSIALCNDSKNPNINLYFLANAMEQQLKLAYNINYHKRFVDPVVLRSGLDGYPSQNRSRMVDKYVFVKFMLRKRLSLSPQDIRPNEHLIVIKDDDFFAKNYSSKAYGAVNKIGGTILYLNQTKIRNIVNGLDNNTVPHELGHSLGLLHVDENRSRFDFLGFQSPQYWDLEKQKLDSNNVMFSGRSKYMNDLSSVEITPGQIDLIILNYKLGNINLR
jgi:hypothetical protein